MRQRYPFKCIGVQEAAAVLKRGDALTCDVRDVQSYAQGHIAGAQHVSIVNLSAVMDETPRSTPVLIYCYHGHASREYGQIFSDFGFQEVYSLDGGYEAWRRKPRRAAA